MTNNNDELASMSGEATYKTTSLPVYDEIGLNGNDGIFNVKYKTRAKIKEVDDLTGTTKEVYEKAVLGEKIELVWLKLRRQLIEKTQDGVVRQTSEHNVKSDYVAIYHYNGQATQTGILASSINGDAGLYPKMKVNQLVYAMDIATGTIYKVIVKGGSLSMQEKLQNATLFYDYIGSMGKSEHFYTMTNVMTGTPYSTKLGKKYFANFSKGRPLTPEEIEKVTVAMRDIHAKLTEYDKAKAVPTKVGDTVKAEGVIGAGMDLPEIDYGDTGVNVDDIPF